ncbi:AbgT family transporter [Streptomyces coeruleorubidus]|uniref:AbgT family transporter n=1 Tax=Streptomyces coeruleorubidus TaxID=116188 RepID=UPI0037AD7E5F
MDRPWASLREMAPLLVLFFALSQFLAYFKWTALGEVLAIRGAGLLKSAGITGPVAFLGVLLVCTVINLLVTSGSAQWALASRCSCRCSCCSTSRPR